MNDQQPPRQIASGDMVMGEVLTSADYAVFGGQLGQAGFDPHRISEIMGRLERRATALATSMARTLATETVGDMAETIRRVQYNAGMEIYRQLSDQSLGFGGITHRKCCNAALTVATGMPMHTPIPARPRIGTPH